MRSASSTASRWRCRSSTQDRELVAAQAREHVGRAQHRLQAPRHVHQQLVAGLVAERVVHHLEAVEVEVHHREALLGMALHARDGAVQLLVEVHAVGELREAVVVGVVVELGLGAAPGAHVLGLHDEVVGA